MSKSNSKTNSAHFGVKLTGRKEPKQILPMTDNTIIQLTKPVRCWTESDAPPPSPGWWLSTRFRIALLFMGGMAINNSMRFNLSMAMVCMVNGTDSTFNDHSNGSSGVSNSSTCSANFDTTANDYGGTFSWDSGHQGLIFSAIWWSGFITAFPGGFIADRYGPKNTLSGVALATIITTILIPIMAQMGFQYMVIMRFLMGFGQGMVTPTITSAMSKWIPPSERSLVLAILTTGNQIPAVLGNPLYAWFCTQNTLLGGWPMIFYFSGFLTLVWLIFWAYFMTNRPEQHRSISEKEINYIQYSLRNQNISGKRKEITVPWAEMAKSRVIWAIMFMNFANSFTNFTLSSYIPTYFQRVLFFDIKQNGLLSTLPFISQLVSNYLWTFFARQLRKYTTASQTTTSAVLNSIGCFGQALFLVLLSFMDCSNSGLAVALLCGVQFMSSALIPGYMVGFVSIAPTLTGTVRSCASIMGQIGGITSPYLVGSITKNGTRLEWQLVFITAAVILCSANIFWICCGSTEIQPWARSTGGVQTNRIKPETKRSRNDTTENFHNPVIAENGSDVIVEKY